MVLLSSLLAASVAALASAVVPPTAGPTLVSEAAGDSIPMLACSALARETVAGREGSGAPAVATDLAAALSTHSAVARWGGERGPLVVWLQGRPRSAPGTLYRDVEWREALVDGVGAWADVVPGLRVVVGRDSARADVHVLWARALETAPNDPGAGTLGSPLATFTAGRTTLAVAESGRIAAATVTVATAAPNGTPYLPADVRAVVRHELGHALGLAHHAAPTSVMAPLVVAERISAEDRAVARALYALPVGRRCQAER